MEVTNRFKGLDLIECLKSHGRRLVTLYGRQGSRSSPRKRNAKRKKEEKLKVKEKRKDIPIECRVPKNSKER